MLRRFPNNDETAHLATSYFVREIGRFDLYRVNPPFMSIVVSFFLDDELNDSFDWEWVDGIGIANARFEFFLAAPCLRRHGLSIAQYFFRPRLAWFLVSSCSGILLLLVLCRAGGFGYLATLTAFVYFLTWPDLLAHATSLSPDVMSAITGFLPVIAGLQYIVTRTRANACWFGVALGFALLTKFTWLVGAAASAATVLVLSMKEARTEGDCYLFKSIWHGVLVVMIAILTLSAGYGFQHILTPLGDMEFGSEMLVGEKPNRTGNRLNRFRGTIFEDIPVPLPRDYVYGLDTLQVESEIGYWSFLHGEWKQGTWPHYYLMTTLHKTSEGLLFAALFGALVFLIGLYRGMLDENIRNLLLLTAIPACTIFIVLSIKGGFNHHHRYVLMIYPPMFLFAALVAHPLTREVWRKREAGEESELKRLRAECGGGEQEATEGTEVDGEGNAEGTGRAQRAEMGGEVELGRGWLAGVGGWVRGLHWNEWLAIVLVTLSAASSLRVHPYYTSYFNTLSGGPENGWRLLNHSNIDWGQDMLEVDEWIKEHPQCRPLRFELDYWNFGGELFGLEPRRPPILPTGASVDRSAANGRADRVVDHQREDVVQQAGTEWTGVPAAARAGRSHRLRLPRLPHRSAARGERGGIGISFDIRNKLRHW
ncbi:MAG: hypothetical protein KatS3mg111_0775 [Pirellulaceae bacterium]|nr:MAG: hypothetical protein KatS3mg111_0775 [Pirellulaceae bacterium]